MAARRFSALALWCFVAMAASGVVNALVRIKLPDLVRTEYGWLIIGKVVALCLLGVIGWRQRRSGRGGVASRPAGARTADPAGAGRGGVVRRDVRHRGRTGPHTAPAAARRAQSRGGRDRLRLRRAADRGAGAVRLAVRPDFRHRGDRHGGAVPGRGAPAAPARRRLADGPHAGVVVAAARRCCSRRRRALAATCLRCSPCTWSRTCCCRCWCRSCWCLAAPDDARIAGAADRGPR